MFCRFSLVTVNQKTDIFLTSVLTVIMGISFLMSSLVALAKGHKSDNVIIALAEQSNSCLDISSKKNVILQYKQSILTICKEVAKLHLVAEQLWWILEDYDDVSKIVLKDPT